MIGGNDPATKGTCRDGRPVRARPLSRLLAAYLNALSQGVHVITRQRTTLPAVIRLGCGQCTQFLGFERWRRWCHFQIRRTSVTPTAANITYRYQQRISALITCATIWRSASKDKFQARLNFAIMTKSTSILSTSAYPVDYLRPIELTARSCMKPSTSLFPSSRAALPGRRGQG